MTAKSAAPAGLTWSRVTARRIARHALAEPATDLGTAGIAGVLCGAHAQVLSAAELAIGRRIAGWLARPPRSAAGPSGRPAGEPEGAGMGRRRRDPDAAPATPRDPPAALLRRVRRRGSAPGMAVPGRGRDPRAHPGGPGRNLPVLLVDGVVGGGWHQRRSGRKLAITLEPLRELTAPQRRQLDGAIGLVGAVMEATATLTAGTVTTGPHA